LDVGPWPWVDAAHVTFFFTFDSSHKPTNSNPSASGKVKAFPFASTAQGPDVTQTWKATHRRGNGGTMDRFIYGHGGSTQAMGIIEKHPPNLSPDWASG
jgi:hypothetical protein